ncbi:lysylphosphatidylglycerol synthase transmembrane domain-containing protein [Halosimplex pelagicum]|uniref:Flippase-like domain-containing protein n=1 Tax=Halosimplex pelagicum TaxID=869886 RepID=A0A7D5PGF9_9EURY|nr:lysylphosphatidylglycerol synthase transmembrane domain-containing protein [Halosimplex pelagicum]QLH83859.1 flippase-like domain-containing protein [Halosimplex pelagicum]
MNVSGGDDSSAGRDPRRTVLSALQWLVAAGAFWYVARGVDWSTTRAELATLDAVVVAGVLAITAAEFGSRFAMWHALLNGLAPTTLRTTASVDLVIKFVNHVVPSKASGHSVAPLVVRHYTGADWAEAVSVAGLNTGLYAALYGLVALAGLGLFAPRLGGGWLVVILLSTALYLVAGALVLLAGRRMNAAGRLASRLGGLLGRVPRVGDRLAGVAGALPSFTADSAGVFRRLSAKPSVVGPYALGWVGTLMVFPGLRVWLVLTGLGGEFAPAALLPVVLVTAYSVTVLPLTPGGVGVAEASATAVLVALGVAPELAPVVVLLDRTFGVYLPAVLGWLPAANLDFADLLVQGEQGDG